MSGVRKKTIVKGGVEIDNPYYEGKLSEKDREYIKGYDFAVEGVVRTIFDNIGEHSFAVEGYDMDIGRFLLSHPEIRQKMRDVFLDEFEYVRNEIVALMIDKYSAGNKARAQEE